ncbi:hypothetical protein VaNZ11_013447 [Volvox africanus]|uniref:Apyrase n=1 Tax=Volvox africanus TaxID=51714 RepID=A0ABQ5SHL0_9CHLO|nr:hypothetical protein VaNZ11_013447 [Volvox africanus]
MISNKPTSALCGPLQCSLLALAALVLFLLWTRAPITAEYVAVIDCGSSGTRIYVYTWRYADARRGIPDLELIPPSAAPDLVPKKSGTSSYNRVETLPGVDSFVDRPEQDLEALALGPLLTWARAVIPARQLPAVPILLFATAGVRRMPPAKRQRLMERARDVLRSSGFRFEPDWARIISGTDEGVYGWIAINYLRGHLDGPTSLAVAYATAAAARAGGTEAAAAVAAAMGRRGGGWVAGASGAVGGANVVGLGAAASSLVATVGSLDLGGSSLEMVYCSEAVLVEDWRRQQRHPQLATMEAGIPHNSRKQLRNHHNLNSYANRHGRQQISLTRRRQLQLQGQVEGQDSQTFMEGQLSQGHRQAQHQEHADGQANVNLAERRGDGSVAITEGLPSRGLLLGPRFYTLRTHTFQRYGLNDAFDRSISLLLKNKLVLSPPTQSAVSHTPLPSPGARLVGTQLAEGGVQDQTQSSAGQDQRGAAVVSTGAFIARPQRPALVRQGDQHRLPPSPLLQQVAAASGSPISRSLELSLKNETLRTAGQGRADIISGTGSADDRSSVGILVRNVSVLDNITAYHAASAQQHKVLASGEEGSLGTGGGSMAQQQSTSDGAQAPRTASITGPSSASESAAGASTTAFGSAARNPPVRGADGTAAAKLRTQTAILEQQKRDSERIIQLVKEQLSAAQERGGGGEDAAASSVLASKSDTAATAAEGTAATAAGGGDGAGGDRGVAVELVSSSPSGVGRSSTQVSGAAVAHRTATGSTQSAGLGAAGHAWSKQGVMDGIVDTIERKANAKASEEGVAMGVRTSIVNGTGQASGADAGAAGRVLMARRATAAVARIGGAGHGRWSDMDPISEASARGDLRGRTSGSVKALDSAEHKLERPKMSGKGARGTELNRGVGDNGAQNAATEDGPEGGRGEEESVTDSVVWKAQQDDDSAWDQDLEGDTSADQQWLAQRDLLAAAAVDMAQGASFAERTSVLAEETARRAAESSEKGLVEAAGLAAAAVKTAAGQGGVLIVGRDDADVSGLNRQELVLRHPCIHQGFIRSYKRIQPHGVLPEVAALQLVGSPDWKACLTLVARTVNASASCNGRHCVLGSAQPELKGPFVALAGFYVVWTFFGLRGDEGPEAVLQAAHAHCSRPWGDVEARMGHHINVEKYCLWGPYVAHLLTAGLGLAADEFTIGTGDVGWPIGAALAEALQLPGMGPQLPLLPRLAFGLLPTGWLSGNGIRSYKTSSGLHWEHQREKSHGGDHVEVWPLGLGRSLFLMWAAFLVLFLAWCSFYMAVRSWLRSNSIGVAAWRVASGASSISGLLLSPIGGRARQSPQRRPWLV